MNPNQFGLVFHHMGLAVRDPMPSIAFLEAIGYRHGAPIFDPLQGVNLAMCQHPFMPAVELVWPGSSASPIDRIVRNTDAAIYHLCFVAADTESSLAAMEQAGLEIIEISPSKPAKLFSGDKVSFHCIGGFGLIEILERDPAVVESPALID